MWRGRWNLAATLAAAYLLVLQSVFGAFAFGVGSNPARIDAFGNVICSHEGVVELPGRDPGPRHMPACCTLGCAVAASALAPPPETEVLFTTACLETAAVVFPESEHLAFGRERSPSNPRAPPLAA